MLSDGSNTYLYGLGRIGSDASGGWGYHLGDALGTLRQLTGASGEITRTQSFEPFGAPLSSSGTATSEFGFTGEQDDIAGLVFLRARFYYPSSGRFITKDRFPGFSSLPTTLHPYIYGINNPIRFNDPSGQVINILAILGIGGLAGGIANVASYLLSTPNCDWTWQSALESFGIGFVAGFIGTGATLLVAAILPSTGFWSIAAVSAAISGGTGGGASTIIYNLLTDKPIFKGIVQGIFWGGISAAAASYFFPIYNRGPDPHLRWTSGWPFKNAHIGRKTLEFVRQEIAQDESPEKRT